MFACQAAPTPVRDDNNDSGGGRSDGGGCGGAEVSSVRGGPAAAAAAGSNNNIDRSAAADGVRAKGEDSTSPDYHMGKRERCFWGEAMKGNSIRKTEVELTHAKMKAHHPSTHPRSMLYL